MLKLLTKIFSNNNGNDTKDKLNKKDKSMSDISINGRKKVSTLKREFRDKYGLQLKVKVGRSNSDAPTHKTLSQVRDPKAPAGSGFTINSRMLVGNVEKKFLKMGLKVNIKGLRNQIISNDVTLSSVTKK